MTQTNIVQFNPAPKMEMLGTYHIPVNVAERQVTLNWHDLESMFLDKMLTPKQLVYLALQAMYPGLSKETEAIASISPEQFILEFPRITVENSDRMEDGRKLLLSPAKVAIALNQLIEDNRLLGASTSIQVVQLVLPVGE